MRRSMLSGVRVLVTAAAPAVLAQTRITRVSASRVHAARGVNSVVRLRGVGTDQWEIAYR